MFGGAQRSRQCNSIAIKPEGSSETRNSKSKVSSLHQTGRKLTQADMTKQGICRHAAVSHEHKEIRCQR